MTMGEWYAEYEFHADQSGSGTYPGGLTQGDVDDLTDDLTLTDAEWQAKHGSPSS